MWQAVLSSPVAVVAGAVVLLALAVWLGWSRPWAGPRTRYPILLAHGLMGFHELGVGQRKRAYFNGVAEHLRARGVEVIGVQVHPTASIRERATRLAEAIESAEARKVNVIAHSMGGLDARYAISHLGVGRRVASLTTIGTPHRGTRVADLGTFGIKGVLDAMGLRALRDLTSASMEQFNADTPNVRGVRYACVLSSISGPQCSALLRPTHALLAGHGENDGMVTVESQRWGRVLFEIEADHWGEIGWSGGVDAPALYERIARRLRRMGR